MNDGEKEKALQAVRGLPENASIEDAMERLLFLATIEKGMLQADTGQTIPHERVRERQVNDLACVDFVRTSNEGGSDED